jgi:hypothetical protein
VSWYNRSFLTASNSGYVPLHHSAPDTAAIDVWPSPTSLATAPMDNNTCVDPVSAAPTVSQVGSSVASDSASGLQLVASSSTSAHTTYAPAIDACPQTCLQDRIRKPKVYTDGSIRYGCIASTISESRNVNEALSNDNQKAAMDNEFSALMRNRTWHLVPPHKGSKYH